VNVASATRNLDAYDLYLRGRELFIARENLPTSWELLQQATHLDPDFARAWETLAAVHSVATSWFPGDGIDHESQALAAARRALEIDPSLSLPHAVIGMKYYVTGAGYTGALASLDTAIENDPRNATAFLWRGITIKELGYLQRALDDFEACLAIDPAYLHCQQWRAEALLGLGRVQEAVRAFEATLEFNFHSASDAFVSYYVRTGQKKMAWLVASLALRKQFAPIRDWVAAIEDPEADHSVGLARFEDWGAAYNMGICDMISVAVAFGREDCYDHEGANNVRLMWHPDTALFRKSEAFSDWATANALPYWQENGFPPQCRQDDNGSIACD
jgi:tetratricopeptide (TPR) repeat protein